MGIRLEIFLSVERQRFVFPSGLLCESVGKHRL